MHGNTGFDELGINVDRHHGQARARCPQCQSRNKTLSVDIDRGLYHCFRCDWSGRIGGSSHWVDDQLEKLREAEKRRKADRKTASQRAAEIWKRARPAMWHDYLRRKGVLPVGLGQDGDNLVVPLQDIDGGLHNVQLIDRAGNKRFLKNGRVKGCFYEIAGNTVAPVYIVEGVATGLSLHQYFFKHAHVVVAFNAGNLIEVAKIIRRIAPTLDIVIAADNDQWTPGNPGLDKGRQAAAAVGAKLIYPKFDGHDVSGKPTDFNDLHMLKRRRLAGREVARVR